MENYEQWLLKADNDLKSAKKLAGGDDPLLDTALFHTQQAVEKCLKGFLAYHKQPLQKTHDLELLLEFCLDIDEAFAGFVEAIELLTPYATAYRYPDINLMPEEGDTATAITQATLVVDFVCGRLKR